MEEVINYIGENQMLFYVIGVSLVLAIILVLAIQLFSHKSEKEEVEESMEDFSNKKNEFLNEFQNLQESIMVEEVPKEEKNEEIEVLSFDTEELEEPVLALPKEEIKVTPIELHEDSKPTSEIDLLLDQMKKDITDYKVDPIESFEAFQEENAIISYEELVKASKNESLVSAEEEESQPIIMSVRELEALNKKESQVEVIEKEESLEIKENKGKFKNTEFISPIYGKINSDSLDYPKIPSFKKEQIEPSNIETPNEKEIPLAHAIASKTANTVEVEEPFIVEELSQEMKRNEEFLQALKEFRKNL